LSAFSGKRVLVTGGTGMIGSAVTRRLLEQGAELRVASMDSGELLPPSVDFTRADLTVWETCTEVVKDMDMVFHVAGIKGSVGIGRSRGASFLVPLLLMNTMILEASRRGGVEKLLYTSSIGAYSEARVFREEDAWAGAPHSSDTYGGWGKRIGELQLQAYLDEYDMKNTVIVRPTSVYGPLDNFDPRHAMVIPALIARAVGGENPLRVWGNGRQTRDFLYADDCAEGILLAMEHGSNAEIYNLCSGEPTTIRTVAEEITKRVSPPPEVLWDESKEGGENTRIMDPTKATTRLGFTASTPLSTGIENTVAWYQENREKHDRYNPFEE
jgi:GDP-L-fucose synthase